MKLLLSLLIAALPTLAADAPKPTPTPVWVAPLIDPAIQIEVLATQYDLAMAKLAAAPYDQAVSQKQTEAQPSMDNAQKACGTAFDVAMREKKVVCVPANRQPIPPAPAKQTPQTPTAR